MYRPARDRWIQRDANHVMLTGQGLECASEGRKSPRTMYATVQYAILDSRLSTIPPIQNSIFPHIYLQVQRFRHCRRRKKERDSDVTEHRRPTFYPVGSLVSPTETLHA